MKRQLHLRNRQRKRPLDLRLLRRIVETLLLECLAAKSFNIGVCFVSSVEMARLNETFLRHAGPTDVITFDYSESSTRTARPLNSARLEKAKRRDGRPALHGEIFVCVDEAVSQARRFRVTWQSELVRYIVHGVLHLLGFDDQDTTARRKMKREESRRLRELTLRFPLPKLTNRSRGRPTSDRGST